MLQNYPNPFNDITVIYYQIQNYGFVSIKIYNREGSEVAILVNKRQMPGSYNVKFDGTSLSGGIYFCRIKTGDFTATKEMVLLK